VQPKEDNGNIKTKSKSRVRKQKEIVVRSKSRGIPSNKKSDYSMNKPSRTTYNSGGGQ